MNKKEKIFLNLLYTINILLIIIDIIIVCVKGATLSSNIGGWICALIWCISHWLCIKIHNDSLEVEKEYKNNLLDLIKRQQTKIKEFEKKYNSEDNIDEQ